MAAPTLFAAGALFAAASGTNITAVIPASCVADDIMVLVVSCNVSSTFTTPTDWTQFGAVTTDANMSFNQFWKRHDGSESDPSVTTSATGSSTQGLYGRIYVFRGCVNSGTPMENVIAGGPTSSSTPTIGGVNVSGEDRLVVGIALVDDDNTWSSGNPPTNWIECGSRLASTTGGDCMSHAISRVRQSGTYGSQSMGTMSATDYWCTIGFALIPEVINRTASLSGTGTVAATGKIIHHSRTGSASGTGTLTATGDFFDPPSGPILLDTEVNPAGDVTLTGDLVAGDLAIVVIAGWNGNSLTISSAVSGESLTWTTRSINSNNSNKHTYVAIAYATVSSDIPAADILVDMTNTPGAGTTGDYAASLYRLPGASFVQFKTGSGDVYTSDPTTFSITLDAAPSTDNGTLLVFGVTRAFDGQNTINVVSGWEELEGNEDGTLNDLSYIVGWRENSTSTTVSVQFNKDEYREAMVAVEFALSAAAITRTGSLAGTGTLTATGKIIVPRTGSLTGTGTLAATPKVIVPRTGSLSGTGTLAGTGAVRHQRTGSLTGTGSLTAVGSVRHQRTASLTSSGVLTATGTSLVLRTGSLLGAGVFTAIGAGIRYGDGTLNGAGLLTAIGKAFTPRTGSLVGTSSIAATGKTFTPRQGLLPATGVFTATGRIVVPSGGNLIGVSTFAATGLKISLRTASLVGTGTLASSGSSSDVVQRTGALTGTGLLTANGVPLVNGSLQGTATLAAVGFIVPTMIQRTGAINGQGTFTAYGTTPGEVDLTSIGVYTQLFDPLTHIKRTVIITNPRTGTKV